MNIVHINTFPAGGAAVAALRLHHELLREHINSHFVSISTERTQIPNSVMIPFAHPTYFQRISNALGVPVAAGHIRERLLKEFQPKCEYLGIPQSDYSVESLDIVKEADVINLHWVSRLLDYQDFFKKINKPVVWTLHDLSPFMGCFNYPIDQHNNLHMKFLDDRFLQQKISIYKDFPFPIHFVGPSRWILDEAKSRIHLSNFFFHHIPYGIDAGHFSYIPMEDARGRLGLPEKETIVLFIAEKVETKRKRFDLIYRLAHELSGHPIHFISIGGGNATDAPQNISFKGKIDSLEKMNLYYSAADYFLMPSQEDNFPNVVLESLSCGTPVISNNVGGMKDIINASNGFLVDDFDTNKVKQLLLKPVENNMEFDRKNISVQTKMKYDVKIMAERYLKLYREILVHE